MSSLSKSIIRKLYFFSDVDSEPIDMEARLKEVNRALAEDVTPLESNRNIKIRFCEVIASYQSPRDYYISGKILK